MTLSDYFFDYFLREGGLAPADVKATVLRVMCGILAAELLELVEHLYDRLQHAGVLGSSLGGLQIDRREFFIVGATFFACPRGSTAETISREAFALKQYQTGESWQQLSEDSQLLFSLRCCLASEEFYGFEDETVHALAARGKTGIMGRIYILLKHEDSALHRFCSAHQIQFDLIKQLRRWTVGCTPFLLSQTLADMASRAPSTTQPLSPLLQSQC